jgi:hypothetical protein
VGASSAAAREWLRVLVRRKGPFGEWDDIVKVPVGRVWALDEDDFDEDD